MPALPIKIWTGGPVLHIAVPCDAPKNAKKYAKKRKRKFYLGNLRILKFQFDNCHARGENRFTDGYKNLSVVTDI